MEQKTQSTSEPAQQHAAAHADGPAPQGHQDAAIDNSPRIATQRAQVAALQQSPRAMAQRLHIRAAFGPTVQRMPHDEPMPASPVQRANRTGLPDPLKAGIESLSGISMDHVKVHYDSSQPAQLQALAYAQGGDIHLAPGQERHLPHEAWHVVQQARGDVAPTTQLKAGIAINDDPGLEREADLMGAQAMQMGEAAPSVQLLSQPQARGGRTVQRARGGMEYTEGGTTTLTSHAGGAPPGGTAPVANQLFGATTIEAYQVPDALMGAWAGARRNTDHEVMRNNRVKLTNDVRSAEWVVEGHAAGGVSARQLIRQTLSDVAAMFRFRRALKTFADANTIAGHKTVLAPAGTGDLANPGAQGLFVYDADNLSSGKVQITAQYTNVDSIRRINELNASKYLTGTKVAEGRDTDRVAGSRSLGEVYGDWQGTTSSVTAAALHADMLGLSVGLAAGGANLTAAESALVKLMVVNDAVASTMSRHAAIIGQAQEKNIQRFFPKAERQTYVEAVAHAAVPPLLMTALRADIVGNQAAMAQAVWNRADPFALSLTDSIRERTAVAAAAEIALAQTDADAAVAAPTVAGVTVTASITAINAFVAGYLSKGITRAPLIGAAAQRITATTGVAGADATAIATVVVDAATVARDNVALAMLPLLAAQRDNTAGLATTQTDRDAIKDLVLGANGGQLAAWIGRAALAYTDASGAATDHVDAGTGTGNVIRSTLGYTPVAGGGQGAIYEFREREIQMSEGDTDAFQHALTDLFGAAD